MNVELMKMVERVVRPLPCDKTRKNRMRADLYAQLEQIFEEELAKDGSPTRALSRAEDRFGPADPLRKELLATIPLAIRGQCTLDNWLSGRREGQSTLRFAVELGVRAGLTLILFFVVMMGCGRLIWQDPIVLKMWPTFLTIALLFGGNSFTLVFLGNWALGAFQLESPRMRLVKPRQLLLAAMGAGFSVAISLLVLIEVSSPAAYWGGLPGVFLWPLALATILFLIVVGLFAQVELEDRRWSQLELN